MQKKITLHTWFQNNPIEVDVDGLTFEPLDKDGGSTVTIIKTRQSISCVRETPEQIRRIIGE